VVCSPDSLDFYDGRYPDASKRPALSIFFASVPVLDGQSVTLEDDYRYNGDAVNASEARVAGCESVRESSLSVVDGGVTRQGVAAAVACLAVAAVAAGVAVTMYRERPRAASQARARASSRGRAASHAHGGAARSRGASVSTDTQSDTLSTVCATDADADADATETQPLFASSAPSFHEE
jgi:hypothetical protein